MVIALKGKKLHPNDIQGIRDFVMAYNGLTTFVMAYKELTHLNLCWVGVVLTLNFYYLW
jgi:hypothetical protein